MLINTDKVFDLGGSEIFIGDANSALDKQFLKHLNITHILNAAEREVFTGSSYYAGNKYLGLKLTDLPNENIYKYLHLVADFIHSGLSEKGKIFVHCAMGISRSATCVVAYLVKHQHMDVQHAIQMLRQRRKCIQPNPGFVNQLYTFQLSLDPRPRGL